MKKMFLLMVAVFSATMIFAQNTLVATLIHGESVTMFYGEEAFASACNKAVNGDIINLSGGTFKGTNITKAITIRGAGIDDVKPTIIKNTYGDNWGSADCFINIPTANNSYRFSMEGVRMNYVQIEQAKDAYFLKCQIETVKLTSTAVTGTMFVDCKITDYASIFATGTLFQNCYVSSPRINDSYSIASFINCVLYYSYNYEQTIEYSQFINCIICDFADRSRASSNSLGINCVAVGPQWGSNFFSTCPEAQNCSSAVITDIFKTYRGYYTDSETFELTDTAKKRYRGNDNTEVGMYGGIMPYTSTPSYPRITKMNVANKTTADGKLSVEIEVSAAE